MGITGAKIIRFDDVPEYVNEGGRNQLCRDLLQERQPRLDVTYVEVPGYGHMDAFIGRSAAIDVFPHITRWLDAQLEPAS